MYGPTPAQLELEKARTGDTFHGIEEFSKFPWESMDDIWFCTCGGVGTDVENRPFISFVREDATADIWEIPKELKKLIDTYYESGKRDALRSVRDAIGL